MMHRFGESLRKCDQFSGPIRGQNDKWKLRICRKKFSFLLPLLRHDHERTDTMMGFFSVLRGKTFSLCGAPEKPWENFSCVGVSIKILINSNTRKILIIKFYYTNFVYRMNRFVCCINCFLDFVLLLIDSKASTAFEMSIFHLIFLLKFQFVWRNI